MDERFSTPRAQASTNRSTSSSNYGTPRSYNLQSSRSLQGYSSSDSEGITPRIASQHSSHQYDNLPDSIRFPPPTSSSTRDYSRDFRRFESSKPSQTLPFRNFESNNNIPFSQHQKYQPNAFHPSRGLNYNESTSRSQLSSTSSPYIQSEDIFSFVRHGKAEDVERLLASGVSANVRDEHGNSLLAIACQNNKKNLVKLVLRYGVNINSCNYRGMTALHFCFKYGFGETLGSYLISKGGDPSITNNEGLTCYQLTR